MRKWTPYLVMIEAVGGKRRATSVNRQSGSVAFLPRPHDIRLLKNINGEASAIISLFFPYLCMMKRHKLKS